MKEEIHTKGRKGEKGSYIHKGKKREVHREARYPSRGGKGGTYRKEEEETLG